MQITLTKLDAAGNDFLVIDAVANPRAADFPDLPQRAIQWCDRDKGFGADGLLIVRQTTGRADAALTIINADGSDGQMSANGARCAAFQLSRSGFLPPAISPESSLRLQVGERLTTLKVMRGAKPDVGFVSVAMGLPVFTLDNLPVNREFLQQRLEDLPGESRIDGIRATFVSMGNPHMVCFEDQDQPDLNIHTLGEQFERHIAFPQRINVHRALALSNTQLYLESWERGCGLTQSCGSGACAAVAAGVITDRLDESVQVEMPGGTVSVHWDRQAHEGIVLAGFVSVVKEVQVAI